jgi:hypothetical protein
VNTSSATNKAILARLDPGNNYRGFDLFVIPGPKAHLINSWSSNTISKYSSQSVATSSWNYVTLTYDGSSNANGVALYVNGSPATGITTENNALTGSLNTTVEFRIGSREGSEYFLGQIDEPRISRFQRSEAWIQTEFYNQRNSTTFMVAAPQQDYPCSVPSSGPWSIDLAQNCNFDGLSISITDWTISSSTNANITIRNSRINYSTKRFGSIVGVVNIILENSNFTVN